MSPPAAAAEIVAKPKFSRVNGRLDGKRIRKIFPTRTEADAERRLLQVQRLQGEAGIRTAITRLTDEQLHEAEAASLRLKGAPQSLLDYLDCDMANFRGPQQQQPLCEAVTDCLAAGSEDRFQRLTA